MGTGFSHELKGQPLKRLARSLCCILKPALVGQSCANAKRLIVEASVADRFAELFSEAVSCLKVGDPYDLKTRIGPMTRMNLRDKLHDQVKRSIEVCAIVLVRESPLEGKSCDYAPTVLVHITPEHADFREELFGPVASIIRPRDPDHAAELANDCKFGFRSGLWTNNLNRARILARSIDAGAVLINGMVASNERLSFGGIKKSGYARELGSYGIRDFTNSKTIWIGPKTA